MSITALYRCYGLNIETDDIDPAQQLGAITSFSIPDDVQVEREVVDGNVYPSITSLLQHNEKIEAASLNVDAAVDLFGTTGLCAKGHSGMDGVEFYLSKIDQCTPGVDDSGVNIKIRAASTSSDPTLAVFGMFTPTQLVANHGANATYGFQFIPTGNAGNAGLAVSTGQTLPAIADTKKRFTLSEAFDLNGTTITAKKSVNINFNPSMLIEGADGNLAPDWVSIENLMAMITITGIDPTWASSISRNGKVFTHANFDFFLRRRKPDSTTGFYANNESEHIKITAAGKAFVTNLASAQGNRPVESAIVMYCEFDGTNAPIVIQTAQQIA